MLIGIALGLPLEVALLLVRPLSIKLGVGAERHGLIMAFGRLRVNVHPRLGGPSGRSRTFPAGPSFRLGSAIPTEREVAR